MTIDKLLQNLFISILNLIYSITHRINNRTRDGVAFALMSFIITFTSAVRSPRLRELFIDVNFESVFSRHMFCTALFILLTMLSIDRPLKEIEWRKDVFYTGFFLGIAMIIISFIHPVGEGYRLFGFQMAFVFPAYYLVWNNRKDYAVLFKYISCSMIFVGFAFLAITLAVALKGEMKIDGARCSGIMANANCFSLMGLEMYLGALYLVVAEKRTITKLIIWTISAGVGIGIMLLGQMRIAILAVIICSIFTIFFKYRYFRETINRRGIVVALFSLVLMLVSIKTTFSLVDINNNRLAEINPKEVVLENDTDVLDRFAIADGNGMEQYSSGRIWIWRNYAKHLNLLGNNYDNFNKEEMTGPHIGYAHNVFLEMGYRFGVPIAIGYLMYMLICGIVCLFYLFAKKKPKEPFLIFPIIAAITFVLESLLDCALLPFFQPEALMYYMSIATVIDRRREVELDTDSGRFP